MRGEKSAIICFCVSLVIMICFYFRSVVELCLSSETVNTVRRVWPFFVAGAAGRYTLIECKKRNKSEWWPIFVTILFIWGFVISSENWYKKAEYSELSEASYLISTGERYCTVREPGSPGYGKPWSFFLSFQVGREKPALIIGESAKYSDTVLLKISIKHNRQSVINLNPTHAEILKYMEPVLFIDGVEQPRPEYDDLKLSDDERQALMRKYRLRAVRVVRKGRDDFLRNLVTLQINDTVQKTVNLMYMYENDYEDIFDSLDDKSHVIAKVSVIDPRVVEVVNWRPTSDELEKYHLDEESYIMLATVTHKKSEEGKGGRHPQAYYAKLRVNDRLETSYLRVRGFHESDRQMYRSLNVGDTVIVNVTERKKVKSVSVLYWRPTKEMIDKYRRPFKCRRD